MRTISAQAITDTVARLCIEANTRLPKDVEAALAKARAEEPWPLAKNTLDLLWSNLSAAKEENLPICQDTGMACVFVELGTDVHIDGHFEEAIHEGVRRGYTDGYLRKSIVADPLRRGNTGDNTPAAITVHLVDGDGCTITVAPKGFGSENMSRIQMLKPADAFKSSCWTPCGRRVPTPARPSCWALAWAAALIRWRIWPRKPSSARWMSPTRTPITRHWSRSCWRPSTSWASGPRALAARPPAWALPLSRCPPMWQASP